MKRASLITLIVAGGMAVCLMAGPRLRSQVPATGDTTGQSKPAGDSKKQTQPNSSQPGPATQSSNNPFPEDTSTVPVMPSRNTPPLPEGTLYHASESTPVPLFPLKGEDVDPVRSPDDPAPAASGPEAEFSSSLTGVERLLPKPGDDDQTSGKKRKLLVIKEPTHKESASKDIEVGGYYLQTKNWKAALSRFESAMILDPENPEVYWGLAEAEHHLGDYAHAKAHYLKLLEYDPDGPHGKQARKELKDPALEKAQSAPAASTTPK